MICRKSGAKNLIAEIKDVFQRFLLVEKS